MIKIPIVNLKRQIAPIRKELDRAVKQVMDNTDFIMGEASRNFEEAVENYCRLKYAIGVSNGTDAIRLSLLALGIKSGDRVICPALTFYATCAAIVSIQAVPVFVDIDPFTYNISPEKIKETIEEKRELSIKAIIPVHLYGQCADMDRVLEVATLHRLKVVEDAAQALGAEYKGRKAGTMGDCAAVSFFPSKNLGAFGDAGMVLTNNKIISDTVMLLRNQGNREKYNHLIIGYNNRLDTLQAAVLKVKLKYLDAWNKKRQANADYFNRNLNNLDLKTPFVPVYNRHIYHQYVLRLNRPSDKLIGYLRSQGIDARVYYPIPLHLQRCFKYLGYQKGDFPEAEKASRYTLAIPVCPELTKRERDYIIASIREFMLR